MQYVTSSTYYCMHSFPHYLSHSFAIPDTAAAQSRHCRTRGSGRRRLAYGGINVTSLDTLHIWEWKREMTANATQKCRLIPIPRHERRKQLADPLGDH